MARRLSPLRALLPTEKQDNPFNPGAGLLPAFLSGRDEELFLIHKELASIAQPRLSSAKPAAPIKITGPSGIGKSALLSYVERQAKSQGAHVAWARLLDFSHSDKRARLLGEIEGPKLNWQWILPVVEYEGVSVSWKGASIEKLKEAMEKKMRKKPVVFLLDNAHKYDGDSLEILLAEIQGMMAGRRSVMMFVAGLPQLNRHLRNLGIPPSYWSHELRIDPLSKEETKEALARTFEGRGFAIEPEALDRMAEHSGNYPLFVQKVGSAVWLTAQSEKTTTVDCSLVNKSSRRMQISKDVTYLHYYNEMKEAGLIAFAQQTMAVLQAHGNKLARSKLAKELAKKDKGEDVVKTDRRLEVLRNMEFLWEDPEVQMGPGIPSLFDYTKNKERE